MVFQPEPEPAAPAQAAALADTPAGADVGVDDRVDVDEVRVPEQGVADAAEALDGVEGDLGGGFSAVENDGGAVFAISVTSVAGDSTVAANANGTFDPAERGLPNSANAGYELFDNVGSLGLTSFMQEVTRVRALEGEVARTIQQISGIAAARVHIVMPDIGNFRRGEQKPTASVMIRASSDAGRKAAASIRQLVASSVPGLDVEDVTILDSTGQLLAAGDETGGEASRSLGVFTQSHHVA